LAEFYNDSEDAAWPSIETLGPGCNNINERTIRRALASLISQGIITKTGKRYSFSWEESSQNNDTPSGGILPAVGTFPPNDWEDSSRKVGNSSRHIRKEPLRTINEPLIEPVVAPPLQPVKSGNDFFTRTVKAYEDNISLITPMIADEIRAISEGDPVRPDWGELAVREAASNNARRWSYVRSIINRYITQGSTEDKRNGTNGRAGISANGRPNAIRGHGSVDKYVAENEWLAAARNPGLQQ
jgi:hypothetical protein